MSEEIIKNLNKLSNVANLISEIYENKVFANGEKESLFLTYFDLAEEHLMGIHLLLFKDLNGSAFALVRPFYETFFRALWVNAKATPTELEEIRNDEFKFKNMTKIAEDIDRFYIDENIYQDFFKNLKQVVWKIMSDFIHSGSNQLSRRWKNNKLEPNYTENEILEVIIEVTKTYLWFSYMLFKIHDYNDEAEKVLNIYNQYEKDTDFILEKIYN